MLLPVAIRKLNLIQIEDVDTLKAIQSGLQQVSTLAELRSIYRSAG